MNRRERPRLVHLTTVDLSLQVLLGHQLQRFAEEGYEVIGVSAPGPYVNVLARDGIRHIAVHNLTRLWSPLADLRALGELWGLFRSLRPDIVHTHNPKPGVLGRLAACMERVPVIVNTVHGLYANPSLPPARRFLVTRAERWSARLSHHEFFQSGEDYRMAVAMGMVRPSRASILGNGVDLGRFDPAAVDPGTVVELRRSWGAPEGTVVVGTVGRLVWEKGYREFFEAARIVRGVRPATVFVAVGPDEPSKEDGLTRSDLDRARADGVVTVGEGTQMPEIYAAFDIFTLASYREGMPRSAIEASAMGRPVIATDIRGCREVVADRQTGVLVPVRDAGALADAIGTLADDPARRATLGEAGRRRAIERFDEEQVIAKSCAVYEALSGGRR